MRTWVLAGTNQHLDRRRPAGDILVDVAFAIGHDGDAACPGQRTGGAFGTVEPAPALLFGEGLVLALRGLAAGAHEEARVHQPHKRTVNRIDRDHRMQRDAAAFVLGANRRGVLDRQHMPPGNPPTGPPGRGFDHLLDAHRRIAHKPRDPDLARTVAAKTANPDPAAAHCNQPRVQNPSPAFQPAVPKPPQRPVPPPLAPSNGIIFPGTHTTNGNARHTHAKMCDCRSPQREGAGGGGRESGLRSLGRLALDRGYAEAWL